MVFEIKKLFLQKDFEKTLDIEISQSYLSEYTDKKLSPFESYEYFHSEKIHILHTYLSDLELDNPGDEKINKLYRSIDRIVNFPKKNISYKLDETYFMFLMKYQYTSEYPVGRIYPKISSSMVYVPKEIRGYLCKGTYIDVDLVNAHPTILYEYSKSKGLNCQHLRKLVEERENVYKHVSEETGITETDAKRVTLIVLNIWDMSVIQGNPSEYLRALFNDILTIREYIWEDYMKEGSDFSNYFSSHKGFKGKTIERQKITCQSYYCGTKETELVVKFKEFIDERLNLKINSDDYSFIPFFDGALIRTKEIGRTMKLDEGLLEGFNKSISPFKFAVKDFDTEFKLINSDLLKLYEEVYHLIRSINKHKVLKRLMEELNIQEYSLPNDVCEELKKVTSSKSLSDLDCEDFNEACLEYTRRYTKYFRKELFDYLRKGHSVSELLKKINTREDFNGLDLDDVK
jgi:HEPN domain-containing protein